MMRGWEPGPQHFETHHWWPELVGIILMAVIAIAVIVGVLLVIRSLTRRRPQSPTEIGPRMDAGDSRSSAVQILEERCARGEIDRDEFLRRRQDLLAPGGPPQSPTPPTSAPPATAT